MAAGAPARIATSYNVRGPRTAMTSNCREGGKQELPWRRVAYDNDAGGCTLSYGSSAILYRSVAIFGGCNCK